MSLIKNISHELETKKIMGFTDFLRSLIDLDVRGLSPEDLIYKDLYGEYERFCEGRGVPPLYRPTFWKMFRDGGMPVRQIYIKEDGKRHRTCKLNIKYLHLMIETYSKTIATSGLAVLNIGGERYNVVLNVRPAYTPVSQRKKTVSKKKKKTPKVEGDGNKNKNKDIDNNNS